MKVEVRFRGVETSAALREHVIRGVQLQLSRFNGVVSSVVVRVVDVNGPRGGADKLCQVAVRGPTLGSLNVEDVSADAYSAVHRAIERAARAVGREIERARAVRRPGSALGRAS